MTGISPPLRFLALVIAGWICLRATLLASYGWQQPVRAAPLGGRAATRAMAPHGGAALLRTAGSTRREIEPRFRPALLGRAPFEILVSRSAAPAAAAPPRAPVDPTSPQEPDTLDAAPAQALVSRLPPARATARWSGSTWLFVREGQRSTLAPGGMLGGDQAGGRIAFRLNDDPERPLALSGRVYAPLHRAREAEAAAGLDWKPLAALPLHLLVERRVAIGAEGRDAFALTAYGGIDEARVGPLRLNAYAQVGAVGLRSRDSFADGSARLGVPLGRARLGAGIWGAAQPGVSRLDVGPQTSVRLPLGEIAFVVAADWRLRVAGQAAPGSGPSLTVYAGF